MKDRATLNEIGKMVGASPRSKDVLKEFLSTIDRNDDRILREDELKETSLTSPDPADYGPSKFSDGSPEDSFDEELFDLTQDVAHAVSEAFDKFFDLEEGRYKNMDPATIATVWRDAIEIAETHNPNMDALLQQ